MITKEQWAKVEQDLQCLYVKVILQCDDYAVSLHLGKVNKMKLGILVYVDGWFKGEWVGVKSNAEEAIRFFPTRYFYLYKTKERKLYKKLGKKYMKEHNINPNARMAFKNFYWSSFKSMKRHFVKHNKSIELIDGGMHSERTENINKIVW